MALPAAVYSDRQKVVQTLERISEAAQAIPGAETAAITTQVPMGPGGNGNGLIPEGMAFDMKNAIASRLRMVTPGYFDTMRIPIIKGRDFSDADRFGALKVMVISEALANAAFPGQDSLGRRIACCEPGPNGKGPDFKTVIGVAGDVRSRGPGEAPSPEFYLPIDQVPAVAWDWIQRTTYVVVRTQMDPQAMANPVRTAVRDIAPRPHNPTAPPAAPAWFSTGAPPGNPSMPPIPPWMPASWRDARKQMRAYNKDQRRAMREHIREQRRALARGEALPPGFEAGQEVPI